MSLHAQSNHPPHLLLVSDIFGVTPELRHIATTLASTGATSTILGPYGSAQRTFTDERHAYAFFMHHVGLERYTALVANALHSGDAPTIVIAFSVGAAAVWCAAEMHYGTREITAICFYGSQIRHHLHVRPTFSLELFFPAEEEHFDIAPLLHTLGSRENVHCHTTPYLHGFMNKRSANFNTEAYQSHLTALTNRLQAKTQGGSPFTGNSAP